MTVCRRAGTDAKESAAVSPHRCACKSSFLQQQRRYQIPTAIRLTAMRNHQNSEGRIRESRMKIPATIATKPQMLRRPLRTKIAPRVMYFHT